MPRDQEMNSTPDPAIEMVNEAGYSFGSPDNVHRYVTEILLDDKSVLSSVHGIIVDGLPLIVVGASGGASGVHAHSMLRLCDILYFAVGAYVCRLTLGNKELDWSLKTDWATCFGIYYNEHHDALISHGELEISRFTADGHLLWAVSGADIFSEGISLTEEFISVIDFSQRVYHFEYFTGTETDA